MRICIPTKPGLATLELTDEGTPGGIVVLRMNRNGVVNDFRATDPLDPVPEGEDSIPCYASEVVGYWAKQPGRTAEELQAVRAFMKPWNDPSHEQQSRLLTRPGGNGAQNKRFNPIFRGLWTPASGSDIEIGHPAPLL